MSKIKTIVKTDEFQLAIRDRFRNRDDEQVIHSLYQYSRRAALAEKLLSHFGVIVGEPDGFDEAGRQKGKLMAPADVVARAVEISDLFHEAVEGRGWVVPVPTLEEIAAVSEEEAA